MKYGYMNEWIDRGHQTDKSIDKDIPDILFIDIRYIYIYTIYKYIFYIYIYIYSVSKEDNKTSTRVQYTY